MNTLRLPDKNDMDRRREPRFATEQVVEVTLLGPEPVCFAGTVVNLSGHGMRILVDRRVEMDRAVKVKVEGTMILGEVAYCQPDGEKYAMGLEVDQVLHEVPDLLPLWKALQMYSAQGSRPARGTNKITSKH